MNNKTLLVYPNRETKNFLNDDKNFLILDENGVSHFCSKDKKRILIHNSMRVFFKLNDIRNELNWWLPIFERWVGKSYLYEDYRIKILNLINYLAEISSFTNIQRVIHFTAVPHHILSVTSSIFSIKLSIDQIFFYPSIFDGRLIPIVQKASSYKREVIFHKNTKISYDELINEFLKNKISGNPPKLNPKITSKKKSFLFAFMFLTVRYIKNSIFGFKSINPLKNAPFFFDEEQFNTSNYYEIIRGQKSFLKLYKELSISTSNFLKVFEKNKKILLIAAHYQPEATSFPEGGDYINHIDIVNKLRQIGYEEPLYYKEHPATKLYIDPPHLFITKVSMYKSSLYLNYLSKLNVVFVDYSFPLEIENNLSEKYLPITITGSIAIERSLVGLKTIVCGKPIYEGLPGTTHISSINDKKMIGDMDLRRDEKIAKKAKDFLKNIMDNNTIVNPFGIATGIKEKQTQQEFIEFLKTSNFS